MAISNIFDLYKVGRLSKPGQGQILVANPIYVDGLFKRTTVLITSHSDEEGTVGLVLNRPLELQFGEVDPDFKQFDMPLYWGGPVAPKELYFIHNLGVIVDNSIPVMEGLSWSGQLSVLLGHIKSGLISPGSVRMFIGYSGWSPGQLDEEIRTNSWAVVNRTSNSILKSDAGYWNSCVDRMGEEGSLWKKVPYDAESN